MNTAPSSPLFDETELLALVDDVWKHQSAPNPKKKRRHDRNRPWHEIARLQAEAEDLEREVETQLASTTARNNFAAYLNNAELKALIRESINDTRALEWNLNQHMQELVRMLPRSMNMTPRNLPFVVNQDDEVFWELARGVDEQFNTMEHVLQLAGLDETISEVADAFVCQSGLLESRNRFLSPFKSSSLVKSLWELLRMGGALRIARENCRWVWLVALPLRSIRLLLGVTYAQCIQ